MPVPLKRPFSVVNTLEMTMDTLLCYEVWNEVGHSSEIVAAYWDVMTAWKVMEGINKTGGNAHVIVACGTEIDAVTGKRRPRPEVIPPSN